MPVLLKVLLLVALLVVVLLFSWPLALAFYLALITWHIPRRSKL